jgi:membrane fusion protein, multidrug efflux system
MNERSEATLDSGTAATRVPNTAAAPTSAGQGTNAAAAPRGAIVGRPLFTAFGGLAAVGLLVWGVAFWNDARSHERTDDAQVEADIIPVLARVGGYVRQVDVAENQTVVPGQPLVRIDDRELSARLARAEADLATARSSSGSNGQEAAQLRAAQQEVTRARAEAQRADSDRVRYQSLAARGIISRQQLDTAEAAARATKAQLAGAQDHVTAAAAQTRGADSKVASAQAVRDEAALELSYTQMTAPDSGVVSKKSVEVGQLVQPGQPLMAIVPLQKVWVVANLKETQLSHIRPGAPVEIRVDTYSGRRFHGHVASLSPATGSRFSLLPPDNATGNFVKVVQRVPVKIAVDDPFDPAQPLRPGMSVQVSIQTKK